MKESRRDLMAMHKRIVGPVIERLDGVKAQYFTDVVNKLEEDPRTERAPNMIYLVLKETMELLPTYLDKAEFVDLLIEFVHSRYGALRRLIFDERFIRDTSSVREVTNDFVHRIVEVTLERHAAGEIDDGEGFVQRYTWPYRATDLADPEDEEALEEARARQRAYSGPNRRRRAPMPTQPPDFKPRSIG